MKITDEIKEQILRQTDLAELIGEVVDLRKRGANYIGLCPFHNEKTPSFNVLPDRGFYKCFGCGAAGDAIKFMVQYHGLSFPEAVKELAGRAGIFIQETYEDDGTKKEISKRELALNALNAASTLYINQLTSIDGKIARSYFLKRGFSNELIKQFFLGFSPDSWDATSSELRRLGFDDKSMLYAGLIIERDSGGYYDRFRGRAMFPIQDYLGKIVGFGARQLDDNDSQPKYINSPQTEVYDKSRILYGLYQAKNEIRTKQFAILTEGYVDVLTLHQAGYKNAVASSGTSLTSEQLKLLSRYCKKIYIVYDADSAGLKAAERALELAVENGFVVFVVHLPEGEDPDSIIRKLGEKNFEHYLRDAASFLDFKIEQVKKEGLLDSPAGKADAARQAIQLISKIPDRLQHDDHINHLASLLNLSESQLQKIYHEKQIHEKKQTESQNRPHTKDSLTDSQKDINQEKKTSKEIQSLSNSEKKKIPKGIEIYPEEHLLINLALSDGEALKLMQKKFKIKENTFYSNQARSLFSIIKKLSKKNNDILKAVNLDEDLNEEDKLILTSIALNNDYTKSAYPSDNPSEVWDKFANTTLEKNITRNIYDSLFVLEKRRIAEEKIKLYTQLKELSIEDQRLILEQIKTLDKNIIEYEIRLKESLK